jgi:hypothetical protein
VREGELRLKERKGNEEKACLFIDTLKEYPPLDQIVKVATLNPYH